MSGRLVKIYDDINKIYGKEVTIAEKQVA